MIKSALASDVMHEHSTETGRFRSNARKEKQLHKDLQARLHGKANDKEIPSEKEIPVFISQFHLVLRVCGDAEGDS